MEGGERGGGERERRRGFSLFLFFLSFQSFVPFVC